jgi:hypothetical protein
VAVVLLREIFGFSRAQMLRYGGAIFAYLFDRISQNELVAEIKEHDPELVGRILSVLRQEDLGRELRGASGYVFVNCKTYAWAWFKHRHGGERPKYKEFKLSKEDAIFLRRLNLSHIDLKYPAYRMQSWEAKVTSTIDELFATGYVGRFVTKCMTFLMKSYGVDRKDIDNDLRAAAMKALYKKFPMFESELHITTFAKSQIHNAGETKITYHTSPCRNALVNVGTDDFGKKKFESRHVPADALVDLEAPGAQQAVMQENLEVLVALSPKMRPDVQRFLMIAAGHYDKGFSEHLECNNSDLIEEVAYSRYLSKARKYFNFTERQVERLFAKLRTHLEH